jgi:hypothetical protein
MLTMSLGGDVVGVVTVGAEGVVGADRTAGSWATGAVGADGAAAFGRVGGAAGVCCAGARGGGVTTG